MILCLIILFIGVALLIPGAIVLYKTRNSWDTPIWAMFATATGIATIFVVTILLLAVPLQNRKEFSMFVAQKEYIENYEPTSEYDTAAIIDKKIELNEWLYEAQYTKEHHPICSFYGDEILELEPIK